MKRTRLSPDARREQLLDVAKKTIVENGLQQFSLKGLATDARVSEPLIFHYFSSRLELLHQLLSRDYDRYIEATTSALDESETLEDVLRVFVSRNYDHHEDDNVLRPLLAEPDVAKVVEARRSANRELRERLLINRVANDYGISRKKAAMLTLMGSAASIAAAEFAHGKGLSREETIQSIIEFIMQGFESQRNSSFSSSQ